MSRVSSTTTASIATGVVLIVLGIGFMAETFGLWTFGSALSMWWPLIVVWYGLVALMGDSTQRVAGAVVIVIGGIMLLATTGLTTVNAWSLIWPAILIIAGASIMLNRGTVPSTSSTDTINATTAFGEVRRRNSSKQFAGGTVNVAFGAAEVDLRDAVMAEGAVINLTVAFGGAEILVPKNCQVHTSGLPLFGGWDDKTANDTPKTQTLTLKGTVAFGGVEIKN